jgi:ribosomal protein S18 acetylase RimI-like enzyme
MPEYILANNQLEYEAAQLLFNEYAQWLNIDLCFQNFDKELQQLSIMYAATSGGIVLCKKGNDFIGCSAIRKIDTTSCELKRMWVQLPYQKLGIGETLLKECIALAKKLNYKEIRLDTLKRLQPAIKLYKKYNFIETEAYYKNPNNDVVYMKLVL